MPRPKNRCTYITLPDGTKQRVQVRIRTQQAQKAIAEVIAAAKKQLAETGDKGTLPF